LKVEVGETKLFGAWLIFWNAKFAMKELLQEDYQEISRDLKRIIEEMMEECISTKSTELLERVSDIKEVCEGLFIQVQAEESQIDWKTLKKREIACGQTQKKTSMFDNVFGLREKSLS